MKYKKKVIKGISWLSAFQFITRIVSLLKFAIIARFISPSDLGIYGILVLIVGVSEVYSELGINNYLIQSKNIKKVIDYTWSIQLIRGILLSIVIVTLAYPLSIFFKRNELFFLIPLASIIPLIKAFENIYVVSFTKELNFNKEFYYRSVTIISDFIFTVLFVILIRNYMGLILGLIISTLIGVFYSWIIGLKKPRIKYDLVIFKKIINSAKWMNFNSILYYTTNQLDVIFISRLMNISSLGIYQISQKFSYAPMLEIADIFGKVTFPTYSKISSSLKRLGNSYLKMTFVLFIIELIVGLVLFLFSREIIILFLGKKWIGAEGIFKLFILYGLVSSIIGTNGSLFYSLRRQDILTKISLLRIIILIPLMFLLTKQYDLNGSVAALLISIIIIFPISIYYTVRLLKGDL